MHRNLTASQTFDFKTQTKNELENWSNVLMTVFMISFFPFESLEKEFSYNSRLSLFIAAI